MKLITILGCTATGKTNLAAHLAYRLNGEIISADSRQVFKQMDIGTGKDLADFTVNGVNIPYHLIDIAEAGDEFCVFDFQKAFNTAFQEISEKKKIPILCGGTGLYLEAVLRKYKLVEVPENQYLRNSLSKKNDDELCGILSSMKTLHNTTDTINRERVIRAIEIACFNKDTKEAQLLWPEFDSYVFGIHYERKTITDRITSRLQTRLQNGMISEVENLIHIGVSKERL